MKNQGNLLDALFELRDRYREQAERGMKIVRAMIYLGKSTDKGKCAGTCIRPRMTR